MPIDNAPPVPGFKISIIDMLALLLAFGAAAYWIYLWTQARTQERVAASQTAANPAGQVQSAPSATMANPASNLAALGLLADILNSPGVGVANVTGNPVVAAEQAAVIGTASAGTGTSA